MDRRTRWLTHLDPVKIIYTLWPYAIFSIFPTDHFFYVVLLTYLLLLCYHYDYLWSYHTCFLFWSLYYSRGFWCGISIIEYWHTTYLEIYRDGTVIITAISYRHIPLLLSMYRGFWCGIGIIEYWHTTYLEIYRDGTVIITAMTMTKAYTTTTDT